MFRNINFTFRSRKSFYYSLVIPASFIILLVLIGPLIYSLYVSFTDLILYKPDETEFIGFKNYLELMRDKYFWRSMWRTLYFVFGTVSVEIILGIFK